MMRRIFEADVEVREENDKKKEREKKLNEVFLIHTRG